MAPPHAETAAPSAKGAAAEDGPSASATNGTTSIGTATHNVKPVSFAEFLHRFVGPPDQHPWPLTAIHPAGAIEARSFDTEKTALNWIAAKQRAQWNMYFNPGRPKDRLTKKAAKPDMAGTSWLWADADPVKLTTPSPDENERRSYYQQQREAILEAVGNLQPPPSIPATAISVSGG